MEYAMIEITGNQARVVQSIPITAGTVGGNVAFQFDESWDGMSCTLVWRGSGRTIDDINCTGVIPHEVAAKHGGRLQVGVYGTKDGTATPTIWADLGTILPGADPGGDESADPALPAWAQIPQYVENELQKAKESGAFDGKPGMSATHKWDGTVLTVTSASGTSSADLKGPKGDPGKINIDDTEVGADAWSSKNTVDKLCPGFTESGSVVACQPVEGYPLDVVSQITPVQSGSGDPALDNVRPITGHAAVNLWRGGKNLFDITQINSNNVGTTVVNNGDGTVTVSIGATSNGACSYTTLRKACPNLVAGSTCVINANTTGTENRIYLLEASTTWRFGNPLTITEAMLNSTIYVYASGLGTTATLSNIQVELGSVATTYEPYRGNEFTLDLGQTVYGGSLDWKTGVLTVDSALVTLTGQEAWMVSGANVYCPYIALGADGSASSSTIRGCCSHVPNVNSYVGSVVDLTMMTHTTTTGGIELKRVVDGWGFSEATAEAAKAFLAAQYAAGTPVQVVYKLTAPTTVQLTPQEILALSGTNTLYSTTGDTAVSGKADPVAVIERLTNAIISLGGNV